MMTPEKLYRFHTANERHVADGLKRVALILRQSVAQSREQDYAAYLRLYSLLLAAWAEARFAKLLYEPSAFSDNARESLRNAPSCLERWEQLVKTAFRQHYGVPNAQLSDTTLPFSAHSRLVALLDLLSTDLRAVITLRNKLAHGQWAYPLTEDWQSVAQDQMNALREDNALTIQLKKGLIGYLLDSVHDLTVSKRTFERDFDDHFRGIGQLRQQLRNKDYESYRSIMRDRYTRGLEKRRREKGC